MISSTKIMSASQIIAILITIPIRPRVKILKGKVSILKIGLMKKLINPRIVPTKSKEFIPPAISTPGTNLSASHKLAMLAITWNISFIMTNT